MTTDQSRMSVLTTVSRARALALTKEIIALDHEGGESWEAHQNLDGRIHRESDIVAAIVAAYGITSGAHRTIRYRTVHGSTVTISVIVTDDAEVPCDDLSDIVLVEIRERVAVLDDLCRQSEEMWEERQKHAERRATMHRQASAHSRLVDMADAMAKEDD